MDNIRILGFAGLLAASLALAGCGDAGDGEKSGVVTRLLKNSGWICPTNEVEIIRGGLVNGTGVMGGAFDATVEDPAVMETIEKAWKEKKEVTVTYRHERASFCRSDSDSTFIKTATIVPPQAPAAAAQGALSAGSQQGADALASAGEAPSAGASDETRDQKIVRLLAVQAELIQELAKK